MAQENILGGGIESLYTIKETLLELDGYKQTSAGLEQKEALLEQDADEKERLMNEEINQTLLNRKEDVARSFDDQIEKIQSRIKKTQFKKDKSKDALVTKRIKDETSTLREENQQYSMEARTIFKKAHIPSLCNSRLYYALFAPKGIGDIGIVLLFILAALLLLPCGIYFVLLKDPKIWMLILIYFIDVILVLGAYRLIYHLTREEHPDDIMKVRILRQKIRANHKKIDAIKNAIKRDSDESRYNLDHFDKELKQLEDKYSEIIKEKNTALLNFESETRRAIIQETQAGWQKEIAGLKEQLDEVHRELQLQEDRIKDLSLSLARDYEGYLGKDLLTLDKIDQLIDILESRKAGTISEAVSYLKQVP